MVHTPSIDGLLIGEKKMICADYQETLILISTKKERSSRTMKKGSTT